MPVTSRRKSGSGRRDVWGSTEASSVCRMGGQVGLAQLTTAHAVPAARHSRPRQAAACASVAPRRRMGCRC